MEAGLLRDALTLLLGFATGVLSALFGIGGAIVSNPGLRALGADPLVAVGTTLPSILPGAISGTLRYRREGLIDWRLVTPAAAAGLLAVVGGSLLSHAVPGEGHLLLLLIAVLLAFTAWRTAVTPPTPADGPDDGGSGGGADDGSLGGFESGSGGGAEGGSGSGVGRPGGVDNPEHPNSGSATLPLRGTSQREVGFSRADHSGAAEPGPAGAAEPGPAGAAEPGPAGTGGG
ncbi:MAG TPA: sulfite exporter TauE/SafE family protein, partial [Actinomycetota bacterium]|nr:sulfite exporter TauE/SafE family protein [Actinomycetota bacterium]